MHKFFKELSTYVMVAVGVLYPQADKKKVHKKVMEKEIKAASYYGALNVCQHFLDTHAKNPYNNIDELIGDLQLMLVETYDRGKTSLNLKLKDFTIEDCLEHGAQIELKPKQFAKLDKVKTKDPLDIEKCDSCKIALGTGDLVHRIGKEIFCSVSCSKERNGLNKLLTT